MVWFCRRPSAWLSVGFMRLIIVALEPGGHVLFVLTQKEQKKSSTNTAPLPAANRLATAHARVGRAVRARPPAGSFILNLLII